MSRSNKLTPRGNPQKSPFQTEESLTSVIASPEDEANLCIDLLDPEGKGQISLLDLETVLIANGFVDDKAVIISLFQVLDTRNTGKVATRDIVKLFQPQFFQVEENIKHIFSHFDIDGKGKVDCDKLREGAAELGIEMSDKKANAMIQPFDSKKQGAVDLKDFTAILS